MNKRTFTDWNDANAFAAAECAGRLISEGWENISAIAEASRRYNCNPNAVARRLEETPFAEGRSAGYLGTGRDKNPYLGTENAGAWDGGYTTGEETARCDLHEKRVDACR